MSEEGRRWEQGDGGMEGGTDDIREGGSGSGGREGGLGKGTRWDGSSKRDERTGERRRDGARK